MSTGSAGVLIGDSREQSAAPSLQYRGIRLNLAEALSCDPSLPIGVADMPVYTTQSMDTSSTALYPLPAFYFKVVFTAMQGNSDSSFQEVRGIGAEMQTEDVVEGGENRFVHRLPTSVKHSPLELKRGVASMDSALIAWCRRVLEFGLSVQIVPALVTVYLLDENSKPARGWTFSNAYPVKWEIDEFSSTKNDIAIETITLNYTYSTRIL
jgi:phage tail-like protein